MSDIRVDDAVISTDVDKLVRILSTKKKIELGQLSREIGLHKDNVEKWLHILEEEGYVKIQYSLTGTYATWVGIGEEIPIEHHEPRVAVEKPKEEKKEIFTVLPEIMGIQSFKQKEEEDSEKERLLKGLRGEVKDEAKEDFSIDLEEPEKEEEISEPSLIEEIKEQEEEPEEKEVQEEKIEEPEVSEALLPEPTEQKRPSYIRTKVSQYLDELGRQRAGIAALKKQKDKLYKERIGPLETRMESDIATFTELLLEKEEKITELKEKALELPDKIEELDTLQRTVEKIEREGFSALNATREKLDTMMSDVSKMKGALSEKISKTKGTIDSEKGRILDLSSKIKDVDDNYSEYKDAIDDMSKRIEELNSSMEQISQELDEAAEARLELRDQIDEIERIVSRRESQLESLSEEFSEIEKVENWIREYARDYEDKLQKMKEYLEQSGSELQELKKSSTAKQVKKYLREFEDAMDNYEKELQGIAIDETSIDDRIRRAEERLKGLMDESREAMRHMHEKIEDIEPFENVAKRTEGKTQLVLRQLEEKGIEREKLQDEVREVKKTRKEKSKKPSRTHKHKPSKKNGKRK